MLYTPSGEVQGYFVYYKGSFIPVKFDFTHYFWYIVKYDNQRSCWVSHTCPTKDYNLYIPDSEVVDQSEWGPINNNNSDQRNLEDNKSTGQPESIDIKIPTEEEAKSKRQLEKLAESIPTLTRPRSCTATSRLPTITNIMTTQVTTKPTQTFATEEGPSTVCRGGGGPPGDEPDPRWFGGTGHPFNMPGGGGGGGDEGGGGGGGGGHGGGGGDPNDRGPGAKLSGKDPVIFDGDRAKAEAFFLEWTIYRLLNEETEVMKQAFSRVMLFLTFIKGPNVQEWVGAQVAWLGRHIRSGARKPTNTYMTPWWTHSTLLSQIP